MTGASTQTAGAPPLAGLIVLELGGLGAVPFAGMLLADLGATVVVLERPGADPAEARLDLLRRGKRSLVVNLKAEGAAEAVLRLVSAADIVLEGFRPGVAERLGVGPEPCLDRRPRLVYGRMTGYGQQGPLAHTAGHDVNFVSYAGVLAHVGRPGGPPTLPLNLIADYAGGGMLLALGVLAAQHTAARTGQGDVVDAAMVDGAALLMTAYHGWLAEGSWVTDRGVNAVDGGSPFVNVYRTADDGFVSFGAVEPPFYAAMVSTLGLDEGAMHPQHVPAAWPRRTALVADVVGSRTRAEWCAAFQDVEACFSPVLTIQEAPTHPHAQARNAFVEVNGLTQPGPAPRFARHPANTPQPPPAPGEDAATTLRTLGVGEAAAEDWEKRGILACSEARVDTSVLRITPSRDEK